MLIKGRQERPLSHQCFPTCKFYFGPIHMTGIWYIPAVGRLRERVQGQPGLLSETLSDKTIIIATKQEC